MGRPSHPNPDQTLAPAPDPTRSSLLRSPVVAWAVVGALCLIGQSVVFGRWLLEDHPHAAPHDFTISTIRAVTTWVGQAAMITFLVACVIVAWKQTRRARTVTFDTALIIGFGFAFWIEPTATGRDLLAVVNRYALNVSTWGPYLPGWHGPYPELQVHTLVAANMFMYPGAVLWMWAQRALLAPILTRLSGWTTLKLLPVFVLTGMVINLVLEAMLIPVLGFYSYSRADWDLSLFGGHWYQLPLTQIVIGTVLGTPLCIMLHHATTNGRTVHLFRGTERLTPPRQIVARLLAGIGLANIIILSWELLTILSPGLVGVDPMPADTPSFLWPYPHP
jgi:Spirocyclase AveC-like